MAKNYQKTRKAKNFLFGQRIKKYEFEGINQINNEEVRGHVQAVNEKEARRQLMYKHVKITQIKVVRKILRKVRNKDITIFTRQLVSMLKAGVPLIQALDIIAKGNINQAMVMMVLELKNFVGQGSSLSNAFKRYPEYFDALYIGLIRAGEAGGLLEESLNRIALQREKNDKLFNNIFRAMIYPFFIIVVATCVVVFLLVWVLPVFKDLYKNFDTELPILTRLFISFSDFIIGWWWLVLIGILLLSTSFYWNYKKK